MKWCLLAKSSLIYGDLPRMRARYSVASEITASEMVITMAVTKFCRESVFRCDLLRGTTLRRYMSPAVWKTAPSGGLLIRSLLCRHSSMSKTRWIAKLPTNSRFSLLHYPSIFHKTTNSSPYFHPVHHQTEISVQSLPSRKCQR
jgi:hypothetical protein